MKVIDPAGLVQGDKIIKPGGEVEVPADRAMALQIEGRATVLEVVHVVAIGDVLVGSRIVARGQVADVEPDRAVMLIDAGLVVQFPRGEAVDVSKLPPDPRRKDNPELGAPWSPAGCSRVVCRAQRSCRRRALLSICLNRLASGRSFRIAWRFAVKRLRSFLVVGWPIWLPWNAPGCSWGRVRFTERR